QTGLHGIQVGDTLEVSAYLDNSTGATRIVATRVERIDAIASDRHILQGPVDSIVAPSLTILGINVNTFPPPQTRFLRADESEFATQGDFFVAIAIGDIVKARGNQGSPLQSVNADEVQIEPTIDN
ncbi:MAG TPA: DUF5666 domain-containing protein, partial [Thermodesulfobacteriota bacterium]|nr:DUF5666 domain-containing protein [Thermodesulfobacteriota bacterium]